MQSPSDSSTSNNNAPAVDNSTPKSPVSTTPVVTPAMNNNAPSSIHANGRPQGLYPVAQQQQQQQGGGRPFHQQQTGRGGSYYQQQQNGMAPVAPRSQQQAQQQMHQQQGRSYGSGYQFGGRGGNFNGGNYNGGMRRVDPSLGEASGTTGMAGVNLQQQCEIYSTTEDVLYIVPRSAVFAMPNPAAVAAAAAEEDQQLASNNSNPPVPGAPHHHSSSSKTQLCPQFDPANPESSCPRGSNCRYAHAVIDETAIKQPIHVNYAWNSVEDADAVYERFAAGSLLQVAMPNQMGGGHDEIPSNLVLKTRATHSMRRVISHCAHYYFNRMCNRGPNCQFIHAISLTPASSNSSDNAEELTPASDEVSRRMWGRTQQRRPGVSAVTAGSSAATPGSSGATPVHEFGPVATRNLHRNESASSLNNVMYDTPLNGSYHRENSSNGGMETPMRGTPINQQLQEFYGANQQQQPLGTPTNFAAPQPSFHQQGGNVSSHGYAPTLSNMNGYGQQQQQQLSPGAISNVSGAPSTTVGAPVAAPFNSGSGPNSLLNSPNKRGGNGAANSVRSSPDSSMVNAFGGFTGQASYYQQQQAMYIQQQQQQQQQQASSYYGFSQNSAAPRPVAASRRCRRMHDPYSVTATVRYLKPVSVSIQA